MIDLKQTKNNIEFKIDRSQEEGITDFHNEIFPSHFTVKLKLND